MRALVTGATGNVGKAASELLLANGWEVVGVARNAGTGRVGDYSLDLVEYDSEVESFVCDQQPFDLVIMTHGVQAPAHVGSPVFYFTYEDVREINLDSAVYLTDQLIRQEKLNPGALIIYCSSIHATQPRQSRIPYAVAKSGLEALVRGVAVEGAPNIRAIGLRLGQLDGFMKNITFSPEQFKSITDKLLLPPVKCQNIARFCLELYYQTEMTGAIVDMDSGHSLNIWAGL